MNHLVSAAKAFAVDSHRRIDHRRKYSQQPYEVHLKAVAELVASVNDDPATIAAAWLHDIVEDTEVTLDDVRDKFGAQVALLVHELTDVSRPGDGNRATRKAIDRDHLAAASTCGQTIKLADLCDNALDITGGDQKFARVYLREMQDLLEVLVAGHPKLMKKAKDILVRCLEKLPTSKSAESAQGTISNPPDDREINSVWRQMNAFTAKDLVRPMPKLNGGKDEPILGCEIFPDQIVDEHEALSNVVCVLTRYQKAYVSSAGKVSGELQRCDLECAIGRMWLFGMLTLVEMDFTRRIRDRWVDEQWSELLTFNRLEKARHLQFERHRRGEKVSLLDCLQLSDKASVLIQISEQRVAWGFRSRGMAKTAIKDLESLRNQLMHSQGVVDSCWPQIARLAKRFDNGLSGESEL